MCLPPTLLREIRPLAARVFGLVLLAVLLAAKPGSAQANPVDADAMCQVAVSAAAAPVPVFAAWYDVVGNQTRMIQVATVFLIAGIALLMWSRGK